MFEFTSYLRLCFRGVGLPLATPESSALDRGASSAHRNLSDSARSKASGGEKHPRNPSQNDGQ